LFQTDEKQVIKNNSITPLFNLTEKSSKDIQLSYLESITDVYESQIKLQKQHWLPDLNLEYFRGSNKGLSQSLNGFQLGIALPILFSGNISKSKIAQLDLQSWEQHKQNEEQKIERFVNQKRMN
jgi:cobalt-zinc-cadmium resistance protein CzcA